MTPTRKAGHICDHLASHEEVLDFTAFPRALARKFGSNNSNVVTPSVVGVSSQERRWDAYGLWGSGEGR